MRGTLVFITLLVIACVLTILVPLPDAQSPIQIFVSATGSGTACSSGTPCSVAQGFATFPSGTAAVIHFASGTYASGIDITKSGSSGRLVLQCDQGTASAVAAINKCKITGSSAAFILEGNNIDIVGFDIGGNANMNVCVTTVSSSTNGNSIHIIGNYCHDLGANVFNDAHTVQGCPEAGALNFGNSSFSPTDQQALRNWIHHFGAAGPLTNCNVAQGISGHGRPFIIEDNLIDGVPVAGIQLHDSCNSVISNNTVIFVKQGIILGDVDGTCGTYGHNTIANNYFAALFGTGSIFNTGGRAHCTSTTPNLFSHNMSDGGLPDFAPGSGPFSCDQVSPNPWIHQAGASFFVNYQTNGTGDYHLKALSAGIAAGSGPTVCISGGVSPCAPAADFEQNSFGTPYDVGAYRASGSSGSAGISFNPTSIGFGNVLIGASSQILITTVRNTGTANLTISNDVITGTDAAQYAFGGIGTCSTSSPVLPGNSCTFSVKCTPTSAGSKNNAALTISDNAPGSPQNVPLTCFGTTVVTPLPPTGLVAIPQ